MEFKAEPKQLQFNRRQRRALGMIKKPTFTETLLSHYAERRAEVYAKARTDEFPLSQPENRTLRNAYKRRRQAA